MLFIDRTQKGTSRERRLREGILDKDQGWILTHDFSNKWHITQSTWGLW